MRVGPGSALSISSDRLSGRSDSLPESAPDGRIATSAETARRYRVLMIAACPFPVPRGTPIRILRMAQKLGERGHDVHVVTYHLGGSTAGYPFTTDRIWAVPTYNKLEPGPSYQKLAILDPLLALKVCRLALRFKPDVIHAHHYEGLLTALPGRLLTRTPIVYDAHVLLDGELEYYSLGLPGYLRRRVARFFDRRLPRRAQHVIAVSDEIRNELLSRYGYPESRVTVVANGVERSFFDDRSVRLPDDGFRRLVFAGNLALYQGTDKMLRAFAQVAAERTDVRLVVITDSPREPFMALARELGVDRAIEFREPVLSELPGLIATADVALNPRTRCPGTPQKLLNYLACGAPVVSFAGSAKYLENDGNALIVTDDDIPAFARAIERLLDDPALSRRLGAGARHFAEEHFSWDKNVLAVEDVYSRVAAA